MKHIKMSKFQSEELAVRINMRGRCIEGESIYLANVTCTVLTGDDSDPSVMISGAASVSNGSWVEQLVIGGLPGVIYELWVAVRTTLGNVYIDTVNIAVLPDEASPPPP